MLPFKSIQKLLASVVLLTTLISFSGFSNANNNIQIPQTELITNTHSHDYSRIKRYRILKKSSKKVTYNQYIIFNFKSLLKAINFDFHIRFKTQKETVLQFTDLNNLLQKNNIAKALSKDTPSVLIK